MGRIDDDCYCSQENAVLNKELIAQLKRYPAEAEVFADVLGWEEVSRVEIHSVLGMDRIILSLDLPEDEVIAEEEEDAFRNSQYPLEEEEDCWDDD